MKGSILITIVLLLSLKSHAQIAGECYFEGEVFRWDFAICYDTLRIDIYNLEGELVGDTAYLDTLFFLSETSTDYTMGALPDSNCFSIWEALTNKKWDVIGISLIHVCSDHTAFGVHLTGRCLTKEEMTWIFQHGNQGSRRGNIKIQNPDTNQIIALPEVYFPPIQ